MNDYMKAMEVANKYGIKHPLYASQEDDSEDADTQKSIGNYKKRIGAINEPVPEPEKKQNSFLKALSYLDRPRAAIWNGIQDSVTGENSFLQGAKDGLMGKENYTGTDLMGDIGIKNETAKGGVGFLAEAVLDPLNLVTLGAGSAAKGAITGTAKALGREGAEAVAKAAVKDVVGASTHEAAKEAAQKVAAKYGVQLPSTMTPEALTKTVSDKLLENEAKTAGRGISIGTRNHNISLVSDNTMRKAGAAASNFVKEKIPVLGNVVEGVQDFGKKLFEPSYINGLDETTSKIIYNFKRSAQGTKNVNDAATMRKFDDFGKALGSLGVNDARQQDEIIAKVIEGTIEPDKLSPAVSHLVNTFKDDFKAWGEKEQSLGVLSNMFDGKYLPHVPNWKNTDRVTRKAGVTEKLKFTNPSSWQRGAGRTLEGANNCMLYKTSNTASKEEFTNAVYGLLGQTFKGKNLPEAEAIGNLISKNDLFDKVKPLYKILDGTPDFFETSAVKAWMTRALEHNKILADKEFIDNTLAAFGERVSTEKAITTAMEEGKDVVIPKSTLQLFRIRTSEAIGLNQAFKQGAAAGTVVNDTINTAGATVSKVSGDIASLVSRLMESTPEAFAKVTPEEYKLLQEYLPELSKSNGAVFGKRNIIEAYAVPQGVIKAVSSGSQKQIDAGFKALGDVVDKFYSIWKPSVTGLNPGYHIRNLVGSSLNNMLNIGLKTMDPFLQKEALRLSYGKADDIIELAGQQIPIQELRDAMLQGHANTNMQIGEFVDKQASMQNRYAQNIGEGAGGIKGAISGAIQSVKDSPTRALAKVGESAGKHVENAVRGTNFLANVADALEKGMSRDMAYKYASEQVNKFHFDYSEITKTESGLFRRVMPFYTWTRKNLPLQLEQFLNNPGAFTAIPKYQRNMEQAYGVDSSNMPEWFQGQMPLPIPDGGVDANGRQTYANISTPQADIGNVLGNPLKYATGALSPLIKVPLETAANRSMLTGAPLYANDYEKTDKIAANVLNQFGVARDVKNALAEPVDSSGKAVAPGHIITKEYSPKEAKVDADYAYSRQLGNEVQHLKDTYGNDIVPNTIDVEKWGKLPSSVIDAIKRTGILPPYLKKTETTTIPKDDTVNYSKGYRARYLSKVSGKSKQATFEKALNSILYKNGGL